MCRVQRGGGEKTHLEMPKAQNLVEEVRRQEQKERPELAKSHFACLKNPKA